MNRRLYNAHKFKCKYSLTILSLSRVTPILRRIACSFHSFHFPYLCLSRYTLIFFSGGWNNVRTLKWRRSEHCECEWAATQPKLTWVPANGGAYISYVTIDIVPGLMSTYLSKLQGRSGDIIRRVSAEHNVFPNIPTTRNRVIVASFHGQRERGRRPRLPLSRLLEFHSVQ